MDEMNALGLSDAQLAERRTRLHAGDAAAIMAGDYRTPFRRVKLGEHNDLYDDLPWFIQKRLTRADLAFKAALGNYLEPFNLAYTMEQTGRAIAYHSDNELCRHIWHALTGDHANPELVICRRHRFMACNLDGVTQTPQGYRSVIDAKPRMKEADLLLYTPAGVWQATCAGTDWWGLAGLVVGNKWEEPVFQEVDPMYQAEMIQRATECWGYIERDEEPPEAEAAPVLPPKPQPKLRSIIVPTDDPDVYAALCRSNNWIGDAKKHVEAIIGTDAAAKVWAIHREAMKELVPEDVGEVSWGRYRLARSRAGAVTQTVQKMEADDADAG
jgi:hypothetical protein